MDVLPSNKSEELRQLMAAEEVGHYLWEKDDSYQNSSFSSSSPDFQVKKKGKLLRNQKNQHCLKLKARSLSSRSSRRGWLCIVAGTKQNSAVSFSECSATCQTHTVCSPRKWQHSPIKEKPSFLEIWLPLFSGHLSISSANLWLLTKSLESEHFLEIRQSKSLFGIFNT